jgi:hypothetical protein
MMERSKIVQRNIFSAVVAASFLNTGILLSTLGKGIFASKPALRIIFGATAFMALKVPMGLKDLRRLDEYNARFGKS